MQLTKREQTVVIAGASFLVLLVILQLIVRPATERISMLRRVVADKRAVLTDLQAGSREYETLTEEVETLRSMISRQQESRTMLSAIERIGEASGLSENVLSLKPTTVTMDEEYEETVVEIRLDRITLAQLVEFLGRLESLGRAGGVKALDVRRAERNEGVLRAVVQLATVSQIGPG
ncbi:MAG: type 4a pilus biogenesis protein PilO [Sedimentisphaerales bacterium]|nr:type 4a pilus biogenesis protein PilO [Sedimentisphaerales bacterium]